jgi:ABC-type uncharacterized transport system ATPase subunit
VTSALARLRGVTRSFGPVQALKGADLTLLPGEVHGVLGANGAGKSTLFNVLGGMITPDAGVIEVDGKPVSLEGPRDAWRLGIGLVHQHFTLVPALTVLENLALGLRDRSMEGVRADAERVMERTGLSVPLDPPVEVLGVGDRQRIEILKALMRDPRVLVLDEPTAVLTPDEIEGLFSLLQELAGEGRAVALVAHKLDEVLGVADRITVLRAGRTVLTGVRGEHSVDEVVRAMVGGEPSDLVAVGVDSGGGGPTTPAQASGAEAKGGDDGPVAVLEDVRLDVRGSPALRGVDLTLRAGEMVGVAGVEGNGQRELALVLAGRLEPDAGVVRLPAGIGFIPQDRTTEGIIADFDLVENVALAYHRRPAFQDGLRLRWDRMADATRDLRQRYDVAATSVKVTAGTLSGGNQQRVVVGREVEMASDLLVAENPTRGLDIAAAAFVHQELLKLCDQGVTVVLVSTDLDEVLALSHRVFAMARGRLIRVPPGARTREGVGALMLGGDRLEREGPDV